VHCTWVTSLLVKSGKRLYIADTGAPHTAPGYCTAKKAAAVICRVRELGVAQHLKCPPNWWFVSVHGSGLERPHNPCQRWSVAVELKLAEFQNIACLWCFNTAHVEQSSGRTPVRSASAWSAMAQQVLQNHRMFSTQSSFCRRQAMHGPAPFAAGECSAWMFGRCALKMPYICFLSTCFI
jgi:hypothetical protein